MIKNEIKIKLKQYENKDFGAYTLPSFMGLVTWMKTHLMKWKPNIQILICEYFIHKWFWMPKSKLIFYVS